MANPMNCKANRCPLTAEFVTDWIDRKPRWGVCRYHRLAEGKDWNRTTDRILEWNHYLRLFKILETIREPICLPLPGEKVREWIERVEDNMRRVITGELEKPELDFSECYKTIYGDRENGKNK